MLRRRELAAAAFSATLLPGLAWPHAEGRQQRLPVQGPAPDFVLTDQTGATLALADLRGKVLALTFIYTQCKDTCPTLTARMSQMQRALGPAFGSQVHFVSVSVEPEVDAPAVLKAYAGRFDADVPGWSFLTGAPETIAAVVRDYGAFASRNRPGDVDHLFLTTLVDRRGRIRVQFLGTRFRIAEMLADLRALMREEGADRRAISRR